MSRPARHLAVVSAAMVAAGTARADTMPQLDFGNRLLLSQVVWGAIIFAGFYVLLARWGLPQVASVLALRARTIGEELEQARLSKASADHAVTELTSARNRGYAESQAAIAEATRTAKAEAEARAAEQTARLDAELAQSEQRIAANRAEAMGRLAGIAAETADAIITRLTGHTPEPGRAAQAVDRVMAG
jgi:F-type H+-transporting ATPase subunit b